MMLIYITWKIIIFALKLIIRFQYNQTKSCEGVVKKTKSFIKIKFLRIQMDHVEPMLAQIICDSTRELGIIARFAMAISAIFIRR